ncbi:Uncharacterised protein [uncultured archaeon]|nr:Uncharacterised protein [uncultured archaeon]
MKKQLVLIGIVTILVTVGLSGCLREQGISIEKIDETRNDFYVIIEDQFKQFPVTIQKLFNTTETPRNLTFEDFQKFLNISLVHTNLVGCVYQGRVYNSWRGYLQYQDVIYYVDFDDFFGADHAYYLTHNYRIAYRLDELAVNMSEQQIEQFPHLKEIIHSKNMTYIATPEKEFNSLKNVLDAANFAEYILYQHKYYRIGLSLAD